MKEYAFFVPESGNRALNPEDSKAWGTPALEWLAEAKRQTGMLISTEVASARHLADAIDAGIDAVWIGARTSANPFCCAGNRRFPCSIAAGTPARHALL